MHCCWIDYWFPAHIFFLHWTISIARCQSTRANQFLMSENWLKPLFEVQFQMAPYKILENIPTNSKNSLSNWSLPMIKNGLKCFTTKKTEFRHFGMLIIQQTITVRSYDSVISLYLATLLKIILSRMLNTFKLHESAWFRIC